jgi:hypothetical protein
MSNGCRRFTIAFVFGLFQVIYGVAIVFSRFIISFTIILHFNSFFNLAL